jgi:putative salt-induced outer membrane protein
VNNVESANRMDGSLKTDVDLAEKRRLYVYNQGGAGYDVIRLVNLEFNEGAGMGYKILQRPKMVLNSELGMQYQFQDFKNSADRSYFSLRLGENMTWKVMDKLSITQRLAYTPDIEDFGEFRVRLELGLSYPLFKRVTLNVNVVDQYDSKPANGVDRNDLQVQSTVGVTF